ncbi:MAG: aspartyl/asparaginyl beta-hydroxylase domain-containing protein [Pseudomonadota bacterium]
MTLASQELNKLAGSAMAALQAGRADEAAAGFEQIIRRGGDDRDIWLGLALARQAQSRPNEMIEALDKVLLADPTNLRALLMKGDAIWDRGQHSEAATVYNYVRKLVPDENRINGPARQAVERVVARLKAHNINIRSHLDHAIRSDEILDATAYERARFERAKTMLFGEGQRYVQEPRSFFYPELPDRAFYEPEDYGWTSALIAAEDQIRTEFEALRQRPSAFTPYIHASGNLPIDRNNPLLDNDDWSAVHLQKNGVVNEELAALMPSVMDALSDAPLEAIDQRGPTILVSRLAPGAHIPPHTGYLNTRLTCHLPIIIPDGCGLRCGNETRHWRSGEMLMFNDSIDHEAWNKSDEARFVLIFFVWRPELSAAERGLIKSLLEGVDSYKPV